MKIAALEAALHTETGIRGSAGQDRPIDVAIRRRRRRRVWIIGLTSSAAFILGAVLVTRSWFANTPVVSRERVRIATVERGLFIRDVAAQGTVVAATSPTLFAPSSGTVTFAVTAGESVHKNQLLASVDSPELKNELQREQASLDGVNAALERQDIEIRRQLSQSQQTSDLAGVQIHAAERELKRAENAWQIHIIPEHDYQRAVDDLETARLTRVQALANMRLQEESLRFELKSKRLERDRQQLLVADLKRRVAELHLRAPVDGVIANLAVTQKTAVAANAPLLTVVDLSEYEIEFRVPESYAASLGLGMRADVAYSDKTYAGKVTAVSPEVRQSEVIGRVRFAEETPAGLRQNQRINLRIVLDAREHVLKVERGAFTDAGDAAYVISNDVATRRPIRLGAMSVSEIEILDGLTPGEKIIVTDSSGFNKAPVVRLNN